jgi:hypothetical protein
MLLVEYIAKYFITAVQCRRGSTSLRELSLQLRPDYLPHRMQSMQLADAAAAAAGTQTAAVPPPLTHLAWLPQQLTGLTLIAPGKQQQQQQQQQLLATCASNACVRPDTACKGWHSIFKL